MEGFFFTQICAYPPIAGDSYQPASPYGGLQSLAENSSTSAAATGAAEMNIPSQASVELLPEATPVAGATCSNSAAAPSCEDARPPRGRMALLEKSLGDEKDVRMTLLREEHALRIRLMEDDHMDILKKRSAEHEITMGVERLKQEIAALKLQQLQSGTK